MESLMSGNAKEVSEISQVYLRAGWNELAAVINWLSSSQVEEVATVEFRFGSVVLIEKLTFNVAYEKIGVAGSHFGTHGHTIDLFIITGSEWKTV